MYLRARTRLALLLALSAAPVAAQPGIGTCVMGEARNATGGLSNEVEYGLVVYQWMDPATCGFCLLSGGAIELRTVEMDVFPVNVTSPFEVPTTVSVIGWSGTPECPFPDETQVIAPPRAVTFVIPPTPPFVGRATIRAPFGPGPTFTTPAFLKVDFPPAPSGSRPFAIGVVVSATNCPTCRQYQTSALGFRNMANACVGTPDTIHYPYTIRPRGDCVAVVGAHRSSWSGLKSIYR